MIEFIGVSKQYLYGARVLGATDIKVNDGEIFALLGDAQSGKTTFIKVAAGVTECEGEVRIDGRSICSKTDDVIVVFDDLAVFENRTFYYNLAYPLKIRGYGKTEIAQKVQFCADKLGITSCLYEKVKKMPLIDRKRLAAARIYLRDARVILVDDITCGLDKSQSKELWSEMVPIFIEKARQGASIIFSTTDMQEALSVADRMAILHYGGIKQVGTFEEISRDPANIWSAQAADPDFHFERARLLRKNDRLIASIGTNKNDNESEGYDIDLSHLDGHIVQSYEGKEIYVGWKSCDYLIDGGRRERVNYAVKERSGFVLFCESGLKIRCKEKKETVCTLPDAEKVLLFDITNENSIMKKQCGKSGEI